MLRNLMLATLALCIVIPSAGIAKDLTGQFGLGYFHNDTPVGMRYWINDKIGLDVGVGFQSADVWVWDQDNAEYNKESALSFFFEVGIPYVVYPSDRANFFLRPGLMFASLDDRMYGTGDLDTKWTMITIMLTPGAEVFFGDNFSLEAGHGIAISMLSVPDEDGIPDYRAGETETVIHTFDASVTYLGFHFYFD